MPPESLGTGYDRVAEVRNRAPSTLSALTTTMLYLFALAGCATLKPEPPGADLVVAPASPRDCQAFYEVPASPRNCRGVSTPLEATLSTVPHVETPGNCVLRCDTAPPRWEVDLQVAGFRGIASCHAPGGASLMANLKDRDAPLPKDVVARWMRHDPVVTAVRGDTITLNFRGMAPCKQASASASP